MPASPPGGAPPGPVSQSPPPRRAERRCPRFAAPSPPCVRARAPFPRPGSSGATPPPGGRIGPRERSSSSLTDPQPPPLAPSHRSSTRRRASSVEPDRVRTPPLAGMRSGRPGCCRGSRKHGSPSEGAGHRESRSRVSFECVLLYGTNLDLSGRREVLQRVHAGLLNLRLHILELIAFEYA